MNRERETDDQLGMLLRDVRYNLYLEKDDKPQKFTVGARVMLIVNLPDLHLCNGHLGRVTGFRLEAKPSGLYPVVKFENGSHVIGPHEWTRTHYARQQSTDSKEAHIREEPWISATAVPLVLAWASTVNKVQGTTITCPVQINCTYMELNPACFPRLRCRGARERRRSR